MWENLPQRLYNFRISTSFSSLAGIETSTDKSMLNRGRDLALLDVAPEAPAEADALIAREVALVAAKTIGEAIDARVRR